MGLFGGSSETTQSATPWAPTQAGLQSGIADAESLYANGGFTVNPYAGDMVADLNATQQAGIDGISNAVPGVTSAITGAQDILSGIANTDYSAIRDGVLADIMPSINSSFAGSGMTGSSLHQQNLASGLANGMADAQLAIQDQQMSAANGAASLAQQSLDPYNSLINAGALEQTQAQNEIDAAVQQDYLGQSADATGLQNYMSLLSGIGGQFGTTTGTQSTSPGLGGILGAGLQVGSLFSDRRLKKDVKQVGELYDGTPVYTYRYLDGIGPEDLQGVTHMGVMAQEAPKAAIVQDPSGFMRVNYEAL